MVIELAGRKIGIETIHRYTINLCRDYASEGDVDFGFAITQADIEFERERSAAEDRYEGVPVHNWPDAYLESLAVYRKISEKMPDYDTVLFHGSCVAVDGYGYLFTAKSVTGKSTHPRLWREMLGDRAVMINDDKPLIRIEEDRVLVFGTPWNGKHRLGTNTSVPLKALSILERSADNHIRPITKAEAYPMLLQQVYRPLDPLGTAKTLKLMDKLAATVSLYRLGCNMEPEVASVSYNAMKG